MFFGYPKISQKQVQKFTYPGISQDIPNKKKKVRISFFDEKKLRISQDIPTQGYHRLTKIGDIPGYPDVWDIYADISSFWDISSNPDLTRLILTCTTGTDFCKKNLYPWDKYRRRRDKEGISSVILSVHRDNPDIGISQDILFFKVTNWDNPQMYQDNMG